MNRGPLNAALKAAGSLSVSPVQWPSSFLLRVFPVSVSVRCSVHPGPSNNKPKTHLPEPVEGDPSQAKCRRKSLLRRLHHSACRPSCSALSPSRATPNPHLSRRRPYLLFWLERTC